LERRVQRKKEVDDNQGRTDRCGEKKQRRNTESGENFEERVVLIEIVAEPIMRKGVG
jgi:hypothetical protein